MSIPTISIIIPVYNSEKTLSRCLNSIISQNYTNWECICVNDGSTDNSGTICDEYACKDTRFRVFHKLNGGVSSARNIGLDNARGKWITFVDSDDALDLGYFSFVNDNPQKDLIVVSYWRTDSGQITIPKDGIYENFDIIRFFEKNLALLNFRTPWAKFFRNDLISTLRFDESLYLGEDTLFCLQYYPKCKCIEVNSTAHYLYTTSDTDKKYQPDVNYVLHSFCLLVKAYSDWGINSKPFNSFLYDWFYSLLKDIDHHKWYSNDYVRSFYMKYRANSILKLVLFYLHWAKSYLTFTIVFLSKLV